eukprot:SAG11_NODE_7789_length_1096_cov_1.144433_1_plen_161_part_00
MVYVTPPPVPARRQSGPPHRDVSLTVDVPPPPRHVSMRPIGTTSKFPTTSAPSLATCSARAHSTVSQILAKRPSIERHGAYSHRRPHFFGQLICEPISWLKKRFVREFECCPVVSNGQDGADLAVHLQRLLRCDAIGMASKAKQTLCELGPRQYIWRAHC